MKKQNKRKQTIRKINYQSMQFITSNLKTKQDFKQFAERMSAVLSALTS